MKRYLIAISMVAMLLTSSISSAPAANDLIPYKNQSLERRCEVRYLGKSVVTKKGEVLSCVIKPSGDRGWILALSKTIPGSTKKCPNILGSTVIGKIEFICLKFSEGLRFSKKSLIKTSKPSSQSSPSANPTVSTLDTPTSTTMSTSDAPSLGNGTGGGAGNGTGGGAGNGTGGGAGKSPSPK